jgi:hypothetical protein
MHKKLVYTIKENGTATRNKKYHREKDSVVLSPCSTNAVHKEIRFYQGDVSVISGTRDNNVNGEALPR